MRATPARAPGGLTAGLAVAPFASLTAHRVVDMMANELDSETQADLHELARWCRFLDERVRTAGWWVEMLPAVAIIHEISGRVLEKDLRLMQRMPIDPERVEALVKELREGLEGNDSPG